MPVSSLEPHLAGEHHAADRSDTSAAKVQAPTTGEVYATYLPFVWRVLAYFGVPRAQLDDAVQDVFVVAHRKRHAFDGSASIKTWLYGIARKVAAGHRRAYVKHRPSTQDGYPGLASADAAAPDVEAARRESLAVVNQLIARLPPDKREIFMLVEVEELSVVEAAAALDINLNTAYARLRAARSMLEKLAASWQAAQLPSKGTVRP